MSSPFVALADVLNRQIGSRQYDYMWMSPAVARCSIKTTTFKSGSPTPWKRPSDPQLLRRRWRRHELSDRLKDDVKLLVVLAELSVMLLTVSFVAGLDITICLIH